MRKRWIFILGIFLILIALGVGGLTWYLNRIFLPGPARHWIASYLAEATGRRIQMGELSFRIWKGISIEDIVIFEEKERGQDPFLEIERITFAFLYVPLLKNRQLLIPSFQIDRPRARLLRNTDGVWNFQSLRLLSARGRAKQPIRVIVPKLLIENGALLIEDQKLGRPWNATLTRIDLKATLGLPHSAQVKAAAQWQTQPVTPLLLNVDWDILQQSGQVTLTARQMPVEIIRDYLPAEMASSLKTLTGSATVSTKAIVHSTESAVMVKATTSGLRGQWLRQADAAPWPPGLWQDLKMDGDVAAVAYGTFKRAHGWKLFDPELSVEFKSVKLQAPAPWPQVEQFTGTVHAKPERLEGQNLKAIIHDIPFEGKLSLEGTPEKPWWKQPILNTEAITHEPLEKLWQIAQVYAPGRFKNHKVSGQGDLKITVQGTYPKFHPHAVVALREADYENSAVGRIEKIQGHIYAEPDLLRASDLQGTYLGKPLALEGTLADFSKPEIDCAAAWGELSAQASLKVEENSRISISDLTARYRKSKAKVVGEAGFAPVLRLNVHSDFTAALEDLASLFPASAAVIENWGLRGNVQGRAYINGAPGDLKSLETNVKWQVGQLRIKEFRLDNVQGEYRQRQGIGNFPSLTAMAYGGTAAASCLLDLNQSRVPFEGKLSIRRLELGRLAQDAGWGKYPVAGLTNVECEYKGLAASLQKSLSAQGRIQISEGQLFEIPLLRGLPDFLGASALRRVKFKDAAGTFTYENETLKTTDLTLYSDLATLTAAGTLGPEKALDFHVVASIDPLAFEQGGALALRTGKFLHKAGYLIGEVKITGTLDDPKRELVPVSLNRLLTEHVFNGLKEVLRGIFE